MARKKISWKPGDVFGIPLGDNEYGLGQVLSHEKHCMDSVLCCFSNVIANGIPGRGLSIERGDLISVQIVTKDSLDQGIWPILGSCKPLAIETLFPIELLRQAEYVGAKIRGSGIMQKFVLAYHGRAPWDEYADPCHFDKLLLAGLTRPANAVFKTSKI